MKTMIRVHLPTSFPAQDILRLALQCIPRLVPWARRREAPKAKPVPSTPKPLLAIFGPTPELPSRPQTRTKIPVSAENRAENRSAAHSPG